MHGIGDQQEYHAAVEQCEVAHHAKNRLLFCAFKLGVADKFGGSPEFRACACSDDFCHRLATAYKRAGVSLEAGSGFDWHGFSGKH